MKKSLADFEWKEFIFEDVFDISSTSSGIDRNKLIKNKGFIPYITRSDRENGYDSFVCEQDEKFVANSSNAITIGLDTQTVFYQPTSFYTGQNIQVLTNPNLNKEVAHFLIPLIKRQMKKFNWGGNGATLTRLKRSRIMLPVDASGEPDYALMESYIKEKENESLSRYYKYVSSRMKEVEDFEETESLDEKEWGEFELGRLFTLSQGKSKGLTHLTKSSVGVNYLGATNLNNGVMCQVVDAEEYIHEGNAIAFIRNGEGSMGYSVYKAESFVATSDISVGYNPSMNRYVGLFITTVADKVRGKYNFGYKRSAKRLKKEILILPQKDGEPDYAYMENYIKKLEYIKLRQYLDRKEG